MCGFAGIINFDGIQIDDKFHKIMKDALNSLYPRGPNQQGKWSDDYSYLVHSRLSILDLSKAGVQPMYKYNKIIVYNGEIYNFKEIKTILEKDGYKFESNNDCEVLLAAWDRWGAKSLDKIKGMFSFVICDQKYKKVFLVRDPFGKKPLVYSINNKFIAFASDLKALEKIINTGGIDPLAVKSLFKLRFISEPLTIYKNAKKVPSGSILEFDSKSSRVYRWYSIPKNEELYNDKNFIEKKLIELFDASVERRLISDVPVGVFLSGGLDSSLIVAALANLNTTLPCFTMGFKGASSYYEERPSANKIANYFGMKHYNFEISKKDVLKGLPNFFEACDEPFADSSAVPFYFLSKLVRQNVTVALSGDGGDEVFGGYRKYLGERWSKFGNKIPRTLRNIIANNLIEDKDTKMGELSRKIRRFLLTLSSIPAERQSLWLEQINENDMNKLFGDSGVKTFEILNEYRNGINDSVNSMLAGDIGLSLPGDMLVKVDKVGLFKGKKKLRETFSKRLPNWLLNSPKKGFEMPIANWLTEDLRSLVDKTCDSRNLERMGIIDKRIVENWKTSLFSGKKDTSWQLWTLLVYDQWAKAKGIF